jgi:hypothetical protein
MRRAEEPKKFMYRPVSRIEATGLSDRYDRRESENTHCLGAGSRSQLSFIVWISLRA